MKSKIIIAGFCCVTAFTFMACKKDKDPKAPSEEPVTPLAPEVITTLRLYILDSLTNTNIAGSPFTFKDIDGEGGQPGVFLNNGADSVILISAASVYKMQVVILDESASPADSISNAVAGDESYEHMFFYNGDPANAGTNNGNVIVSAQNSNYQIKLNGSNIKIRYTDVDNGPLHQQPSRPIGLSTILKTENASGNQKFPFTTTLRHQPGAKDGTYAPGETDIEVTFKIKVI